MLRRHRPRPDRTAPGARGRPRRRRPQARTPAGPGGTRLPPHPLPDHRLRWCRWSPPQGPRVRRGRRPPQGRPPAAHHDPHPPTPALDDHDGELVHDPRDAGARMWDALVSVLSTRWTPTCHPTVTAHPPDSPSPPPWSPSRTASVWHGRPHVDMSCRWPRSVGWRVTPRSSPPSSAPVREPLDVGRAKRLVTPRDLDRPGRARPALRVPRLRPTTPDVPRPPHPTLDQRRPNQPVESGAGVRPPPPHPPPHTLGSPHPSPRPPTRIPTTTQTRHPTTLDPTPTTTRNNQRHTPVGRPMADGSLESLGCQLVTAASPPSWSPTTAGSFSSAS